MLEEACTCSFSIPEDTLPYVVIGTVHASNDDEGKFDYRIIGADDMFWAGINQNGDVFLKRQLDHERNHSLKFAVSFCLNRLYIKSRIIQKCGALFLA